ncbi:MAG: DUF1810 domain-containing protein [Hyphomicrobiaceae bacterium]
MSTPSPFDLARFVAAQEHVFADAMVELTAGRKTSHWMWFVFPQMRGLGSSPMAWTFGISSLEEARAYLAHPVLGPRLEKATRRVLELEDRPLRSIFGTPDDLKFCSCMTLFAEAAGPGSIYASARDKVCGGVACPRTLQLLSPLP